MAREDKFTFDQFINQSIWFDDSVNYVLSFIFKSSVFRCLILGIFGIFILWLIWVRILLIISSLRAKHDLGKPERIPEIKNKKNYEEPQEKPLDKNKDLYNFPEIKEEPPPLEVFKAPYEPPKRYTKNNIVDGQKAYVKKGLNKADLAFLTSEGFIETEQTNIDGQKRDYLVFYDKFESPIHIICVKEIIDYLKEFTQDIQTYRTVMPDIVFDCNNKKYAIEVETGEIFRDKKKMQNKISLLNKKFGKNWFFFVTNRNLENKYAKLGETSTKRNIKSKINKIFRNH